MVGAHKIWLLSILNINRRIGSSNQPGAGKAMFLGLAKRQKEVKALEIEGKVRS